MSFDARYFHYGSRLKQLVDNSSHTATDISHMAGYADRRSLYDLFKKEFIARESLSKILEAMQITEDDFFDSANSQFQEPNVIYGIKSKKFIEERVDDLEKELADLRQKLDQMSSGK